MPGDRDSRGRERRSGQDAGSKGGGAVVKGDGGPNLKRPPAYLNLGKIGRRIWMDTVKSMRAAGILSDRDGPLIDLYACAWEEYCLAKAKAFPDVTVTSKTERGHEVERRHPAAVVAANAWRRVEKCCHSLGIGPRSQIAGPPAAGTDPIGELLESANRDAAERRAMQ